jgi:hypothetical protein
MTGNREPADRVRALLLRGDNLLKQGAGGEARLERALAAFEEAGVAASDPSVDPRVRELVERRLAAARELAEGSASAS